MLKRYGDKSLLRLLQPQKEYSKYQADNSRGVSFIFLT